MNTSEYIDVDDISLVRVAFTFDVDNSETLIRSLWYCCISTTSSSIKYTIAKGDMPLSEFTKSALFPISDAVQYLFTGVFTGVGYSGTSASSNM